MNTEEHSEVCLLLELPFDLADKTLTASSNLILRSKRSRLAVASSLQRLAQQVVPSDQPFIENVVVSHTVAGVIGFPGSSNRVCRTRCFRFSLPIRVSSGFWFLVVIMHSHERLATKGAARSRVLWVLCGYAPLLLSSRQWSAVAQIYCGACSGRSRALPHLPPHSQYSPVLFLFGS